jgi:hypothetical protein
MDMMSALMNARILDVEGNVVGDVLSFTVLGSRLFITADIEVEDGDPDDGAKDDIPEDDASKPKFPRIVVASKDGTDG